MAVINGPMPIYTEHPQPPRAQHRHFVLADGKLFIWLEYWPSPIGYATWHGVYHSPSPMDVFPFAPMLNVSTIDSRADGTMIVTECRPIHGERFSISFKGHGPLLIDGTDATEDRSDG